MGFGAPAGAGADRFSPCLPVPFLSVFWNFGSFSPETRAPPVVGIRPPLPPPLPQEAPCPSWAAFLTTET